MQPTALLQLAIGSAESGKSHVEQVSGGGTVVIVNHNGHVKIALVRPINDAPIPSDDQLIKAVASGNGRLKELKMAKVWGYGIGAQSLVKQPDSCSNYLRQNAVGKGDDQEIAVPPYSQPLTTWQVLGSGGGLHGSRSGSDGGHPLAFRASAG